MLVGAGLAMPALSGIDEGVQYQKVIPPQPTSTADKVEVVELFWYGCPHCFQFEPELRKWLETKPANVELVRMPAVFNPRWRLHAQAFYAAEVLGAMDKMHDALFEALHVKKRRLNDEAQLQEFFVEHGVSAEDFKNAFNSFAVYSKVRRAEDLTRRYGISGVPAMVVNGKYRTDGPMANGHTGMLRVVDYLIDRETGAARTAASQ
ncbi:MAG: hypothetical protein AMJ69_03285 [Gammaproteobacteria bacterium SG8_47]|nr:MAG: hypothetical protein AMJ69_03285 [Gammaproteobacteria bacterium SG8_47]